MTIYTQRPEDMAASTRIWQQIIFQAIAEQIPVGGRFDLADLAAITAALSAVLVRDAYLLLQSLNHPRWHEPKARAARINGRLGRQPKEADGYRMMRAQKILDLFKAAKGHDAETIEELENWLAPPEGRVAIAYDRDPEGKIIPSWV